MFAGPGPIECPIRRCELKRNAGAPAVKCWRPRAPARSALLVALGIRIRFHELGRLIHEIVLAVELCAADASLAPQMMVLVDAHVTLGRTLEFDARRSSRDLIDIEAARLFP